MVLYLFCPFEPPYQERLRLETPHKTPGARGRVSYPPPLRLGIDTAVFVRVL